MGTADRDYDQRMGHRPPGFLALLPPVVKWLLVMNGGIYLVDTLILGKALATWGSFKMGSALYGGHVWEFLTFQFLHAGLAHILMNSLGLYFMGPWLERAWGSARFLAYYLICGVGGAVFFCLLAWLGIIQGGYESALVGASAGIYGILVGIARVMPNMQVSLLFPPVTLTMRKLAMWAMGLAAFFVIFRLGGNEGGEAGHLGGAIMGLVLAKCPRLLDWTGGSGHSGMRIERPKAFRRKSEAKLRPRSVIDLASETEVDRILDKISHEGFQSLTAAERDTLQKASQSHQTKL